MKKVEQHILRREINKNQFVCKGTFSFGNVPYIYIYSFFADFIML